MPDMNTIKCAYGNHCIFDLLEFVNMIIDLHVLR
jgi:hypothetical protein